MKTDYVFTLVFGLFFWGATSAAFAQDMANDPADVWATIEGQWEAEENGDDAWLDELLTDDFSGWGKEAPAPRSKSSTRMWDRFADEQGKTIEHELYPLSIVVHDNVAVAHYLYTSAFKSKEDEVEVNNGRYTDILVRTDDGWKFIAWHGGDDDK
jgi:ketosteroid isomerase-like protein